MARITKRDMYLEILDVLGDEHPEESEFVEHQIELIDKRKSAPRKPTKEQLANVALKADMEDYLDENYPVGKTATEIGDAHNVSVQKASQLLKQLVAEGNVLRIEGKGKEKTKFFSAR